MERHGEADRVSGSRTTPSDQHETSVASSFLKPGWWAECTCGWKSEPQRTSMEAAYRGDSHKAAVREVEGK